MSTGSSTWLVVGVVALLVIWQVSLQATVTDALARRRTSALIWASYPILDAALLALVVVRHVVAACRARWLLAGGVACWLFSDFFYLLFPDSTAWSGG